LIKKGETSLLRVVLQAFLILIVLCGTALAADFSSARSAPASPFPIKTTQPDGTEIEVYRRGDERLNWVENPKGYSLAKNETTGFWEYALLEVRSRDAGGKVSYWLALVPSGVAYNPSEDAPDGWPTRLRPTRATNRRGK
jgi:hypothetical protein